VAKLVLIADGTYNPAVNRIGDKVSIHDDDVALTGSGYATFKIVEVKGFSAEEVSTLLEERMPEQAMADEIPEDGVAGKLTLSKPVEKEVWKGSDGKWRLVEIRPKYPENCTLLDDGKLVDENVALIDKVYELENISFNVATHPDNQVEAVDLNK